MLDGMKYANAGMIQMSMKQDIITNNLANATTTGYRRETAYISSFSDVLDKKMGFIPGKGGRAEFNGYMEVGGGLEMEGGMRQDTVTGFSQGSLRETGNSFDLALDDNGKGFFTVKIGSDVRYTRNGAFRLAPDGHLVTSEGAQLMGLKGAINVGKASSVEVTPEGVVKADGREIDRLRITQFQNLGAIKKEGTNNFVDNNAGALTLTKGVCVRQGFIEQGNVNAVAEMVELMQVSRAFEANQKMLQTQDQVLRKAANELGKVR
ncbi:MAG: flagellar hook-basal body complex protein [Proteobacteria bacterium]|nr:flagellar hook-basal body complex protein [Pseudomonadota bacterium]